MATYKKVLVIIGSALVGGLGGAAIAFPDMAALFAGISGGIGLVVAAITGISLVKGS